MPLAGARGWGAKVTVKAKFPPAVGIPARVPSASSDRPAGRLPAASANVNGPAAPVAVNVCAYACPTLAAGSAA